MRAAAMLTRSARVPATHGALPDAAAQIVATFDGPFSSRGTDPFADPFVDGESATALSLVLLREVGGDPLADTVRDMAADARIRVHEVQAEGESPLQHWASLVACTDFAATYLALAHGIDPAVTPHVAELRRNAR